MSLTVDLTAAVALLQADAGYFHAIVHGPALGVGSLVDVGGGLQIKSLARIAREAGQEPVATPAISGGGVLTLDLSVAKGFTVTNNHDIGTFVIANAAAGLLDSFTLRFVGNGTAYTQHWGDVTDVHWPGDVAPVLTIDAGKVDILTFITFDGAHWYGFIAGQAFAGWA